MMYSIIVPIYKVEKYLRQCVESILCQTFEDFELILVDDGSPDSCPAICDEYEKKDSRVKVIHKKNGGLVSSRKAGLEIAKGDYICFVDGDDFIAINMLETYDKYLVREDYDVLCATYSKYYNDNNIIPEKQNISDGTYSKDEMKQFIYPKMLSTSNFFSFGVMPSIVTKCFKRGILLDIYKHMPDNISLGEDAAVTYPLLLQANRVCFLNYSGYMYRQNFDSMTHTYDKDLYEKIRNLILHLKTIENTMGWKAGNQINEYAIYLLILAKNNEFKYNKLSKYSTKKNNMSRYLKDPIFKEALVNTKLSGVKNQFILACFRNRFLFLINLYESIFFKVRG